MAAGGGLWPVLSRSAADAIVHGEIVHNENTMAAPKFFAVTAALMALLISSANAVQPPSDHCRAASKIEYDSAGKQFLLRNRFGAYVRTGRIWRRHYWYCQL
jgi:hypothetical protein